MFNDLVIIGQGKVLLFTFNNVIGCGSIVDSMVFRWLSIHDINYRKNLETKKDIAIAMSFKNMGGQGIEPWTHGLRVRCSAS